MAAPGLEGCHIGSRRGTAGTARWFAVIWCTSIFLLAGTSVGLFLASARTRVDALKEAEWHALGMRTDALAAELRQTAADLILLSSLNSMHAFLSGPQVGSQELERELRALAAIHPEYEELAVLLGDGQTGLHIQGARAAPGGAALRAGSATTAALSQAASMRPNGEVFVSYGAAAAAEDDRRVEATADRSPLLLGAGIRGGDGRFPAAVVVRLAWASLLGRYAAAHPDSVSVPVLQIDGSPPVSLDQEHTQASSGAITHAAVVELPPNLPDITASEAEQLVVGGGLLTFRTFRPAAEMRAEASGDRSAATTDTADLAWKTISWVEPRTLAGIRNAGLAGLIGWNVFGLASLGIISWFSADRLARRNTLHKRTAVEKSVLSSALDRYMPKVATQSLLDDPTRYADLGGTSSEAAILFADIRGFTRFAEDQPPEHVVSTLNLVLAALTPPLRRHAGVLDKYLGDGFLAFFLSPSGVGDAARQALQAACEMQDAFAELHRSPQGSRLRDMGLGVGVGSGRVVLGNVGSEQLMDFTVIGDAVNVAARLQAAAAPGEILITSDVRESAGSTGSTDRCLTIELRGRRTPVAVYAITKPNWIRPPHSRTQMDESHYDLPREQLP